MTEETSFTERRPDPNGNIDDTLFSPPDDVEKTIKKGRPSLQYRPKNSLGGSLRRRSRVGPLSGDGDLFTNSYGTFQDSGMEPRSSTDFTVDTIEPYRLNHRLTLMDRMRLRWSHFKESADEKLSIFQVSKSLECYGGGVFSYFSFLAWLGKINFCTMVLYSCALIVPFALIRSDSTFNDVLLSYNANLTQVAFVNRCSIAYSQSLTNYSNSRTEILDRILDGLQGTGWVANFQLIFIGRYFDKLFWKKDSLSVYYNTSLAFYLCLWSTLCVVLVLTVISSGKRVLKRVSDKEQKSPYTLKVLTRWDYIVRDKNRAQVEQVSIVNELKRQLAEDERRERKERMSACDKRILYGKRFAVWLLYCILTIGMLVGIYYVNLWSTTESVNLAKTDTNTIILFLIQYMTSIYIVAGNFVIEQLCNFVVVKEEYNANYEIYITILRTVFLRFVSLVVLMGSMFILLTNCHSSDQTQRCVQEGCTNLQCWETYVGQQIYKLVLLDIIIYIGVALLELLRKFLIGRCIKKIGSAKFDISKNVIDLIYTQTLCWLGMFFCPLLPIVVFVKIVVTYILKKVYVLCNIYEHDSKSSNASQTDSYFLDTLLFSLIIVTFFPLGVATSVFSPSRSCGPYRLYYSSDRDLEGARIALSYAVDKAFERLGADARAVYAYIDSLIVMLPIWIILLFVTYFYFSLGKAHERLTQHLRIDMIHEMQDQTFLQRRALESQRALKIAEAARNQ